MLVKGDHTVHGSLAVAGFRLWRAVQRLFDATAWWIRLHLNEEVSGVPKQQVWTESEPWLWRYRVLKLKFIRALTRAYWRGVHTGVGPSNLMRPSKIYIPLQSFISGLALSQ